MVTKNEVDKIALLSRLEFKEEEKEIITQKFNSVIETMKKLDELDTQNVEPLTHVLPMKNIFREDEKVDSSLREEILKNAPKSSEKLFKVPKVINQNE